MTRLYVDNEQYFYIDTEAKGYDDVPSDLEERYHLALLEWEAVQDELEVLYKEGN